MSRGARIGPIGGALVGLVALLGTAGCAADAATGTAARSAAAQRQDLEELTAATEVPGAVCATEARTVDVAVAAYRATEGSAPASVDDLVGTYLVAPPAYHDLRVDPAGEVQVVPIPDAGCA